MKIVLIVALVIVCVLLGFREGRRWGYSEGHADGLFAGEKGILRRLPKSVQRKLEEKDREKIEVFKELRARGVSIEDIQKVIVNYDDRIEL